MKKQIYFLMLVMLMVTGTALNSLADITIQVNMPDVYTPSRGDEVTIYLSDASGVNGVEDEGVSGGYIYRMDGTRMSNDAALPTGIYIKDGKKVVVK